MDKPTSEYTLIIISDYRKYIEKSKLRNLKYFNNVQSLEYNFKDIKLDKVSFDIFTDYLENMILSLSSIDNIDSLIDLAIAFDYICCFNEVIDLKFCQRIIEICVTYKSPTWKNITPNFKIITEFINKFYFYKFIILYDILLHLIMYQICCKENSDKYLLYIPPNEQYGKYQIFNLGNCIFQKITNFSKHFSEEIE